MMKLSTIVIIGIIIVLAIFLTFHFNGFPVCSEGYVEREGECVANFWELANNDK